MKSEAITLIVDVVLLHMINKHNISPLLLLATEMGYWFWLLLMFMSGCDIFIWNGVGGFWFARKPYIYRREPALWIICLISLILLTLHSASALNVCLFG